MHHVWYLVSLCATIILVQVRAFNSNVNWFHRYRLSTVELQLSTTDFKNGMTFELDGFPVRLLEFLHVKPGKGAAFVRSKVKNLISGNIVEKTFRAGESIIPAEVIKSEMQYTYTDGDSFCFTNMDTFEEQRVPKDAINNALLLKEGLSCQVTIWKDRVIDVTLPQTVVYTVLECPPNHKGNTAQGATKPAILDGNGAVVQVPMFINEGESIVVSTSDVKYVGRA